MPELPEVETTRRGLERHLAGQKIARVIVRDGRLRQPVPHRLPALLAGATITSLTRRGKYLLINCGKGTLIMHLGMSGRLWLVKDGVPPDKHDHFDLVLTNHKIVRLRDPRRFGLVLWQTGDPLRHPLLARIGPEPLSAEFDGAWLHRATRNRSAAIKLVLMDSHVVAGIGNIYANEALCRAGINPKLGARRLTRARCTTLVEAIRKTLTEAIEAGAAACATTWAATGWPETSRTGFWFTTAQANRASPAAYRYAAYAKVSARPSTVRAASAEQSVERRELSVQRLSLPTLIVELSTDLLAGESQVFLVKLLRGLDMARIVGYAIHRAHLSTLRGIEVADAFGAFVRVDDVDLLACRDRVVGTFGLAHIAVDALVGDHQRHQRPPNSLIFTLSRLATYGDTNLRTSPPRIAISRTSVPEIKRYCSPGVMKTVSTSGYMLRFIPAS